MAFVSELRPTPMGRDHFRVILVPLIVTVLFYFILYLQTYIKESNDENAIGYTYSFKGYFFFFNLNAIQFGASIYIITILALWITVKTVRMGGTLGNVTINGLLFGLIFSFLELAFYLSYINDRIEINNRNDPDNSMSLSDWISDEREFLVSNYLYNLAQFLFVIIVIGGIYVEISKKIGSSKNDLYPEA